MDMEKLESMSDDELAQVSPDQLPEQEVNDEATQTEPEQQEEQDEIDSEDTGETESEEQETSAPDVDYKGFYEAVMSPIRANGKELQLKSPQEAVKLIQMGANYTQKMQGLAGYRKKIQMLKNADLLDDEKLNYLIDLASGNPEAVKKLLKDRKLDPLDLNMDENNYVPGNHTVSDNEVHLQAVLDDLKSNPEGVKTIETVGRWDQASQREFWLDPSLLTTLNEQRQNGVYDLIMNEVDRQRMLGNIPENTPVLEAYKKVGNYLLQQQQYMAQQRQMNLPQGTLQRATTNSAQVKSAAPTGRSKKVAQRFVDPFSLSDEEFEKEFKNYGY